MDVFLMSYVRLICVLFYEVLTNCLNVFDHFVGLALKGLKRYSLTQAASFFLNTSYFFGSRHFILILSGFFSCCIVGLIQITLLLAISSTVTFFCLFIYLFRVIRTFCYANNAVGLFEKCLKQTTETKVITRVLWRMTFLNDFDDVILGRNLPLGPNFLYILNVLS